MTARIHDQRPGLVLIAASLVVIAVIAGLLVRSQRETRLAQSRDQGVSLARILSNIPYERLAPGDRHQGVLQVLKTTQNNPDFAYVSIVDPRGASLAEVTSPGVIVPRALVSADPYAWVGERLLTAPGTERPVREFYAPVLVDGERVADVRIGYFEPGLALVFEHASFLAVLALPIFLLAPLAYFLVLREVRPLAAASAQLGRLLDDRPIHKLQIDTGGEVGRFLHSFNGVLERVESRLRSVESHEIDAVASAKMVSYQKSRMETVFETLPDATVVLDENGAVTFANAKLEAATGVRAESALGRSPEEWCEFPEVVAFLADYRGARSGLRRSATLEFKPHGSNGKTIAVGAYPIAASERNPAMAGTVAVFRDVTSEALARRSQAEFVTHVVHELKSPLNVMSMYSESLLGKDGESEDFRIEACNAIQDEIERLSTLVGSLMTIVRMETGAVTLDRQRVRLQEFLTDTMKSVSRAGRNSDLGFDLELPHEIVPVWIDKDLLRVAITNLLTNAIKYNREGGSVTLSAEETPDRIVIRVRDTGIGIPEDERESIFEKFFRSDSPAVRSRAGHGLGLALAREIVNLHGAEIQVESELDEGSQFSIVFKKTPALVGEQHPS